MNRYVRYFACLLLIPIVLILVTGCAELRRPGPTQPESREPAAYWPTEEWLSSTPEEQGISSEKLTELLSFVREKRIDLHSVLIVRNGRMVLDAYFYPFTPGGTVHDVASVTKSVTSLLIGIAIDKGNIRSVKEPVLSFFPERAISNPHPFKEEMTIEDLVNMASGYDCGYLPGERELFEMFGNPDWVQYTLDLPMSSKPGSRWSYCSSNFHLLSAIISETTGKDALAFAREHLFDPLGIEEAIWPAGPGGITHGWGDLHLHPHDMAKIGYLLLNGGNWGEKQVIPSDWIEASTQNRFSPSASEGYGYGWWQVADPATKLYYASGRGGQRIYVRPDRSIVLVLTGGGYDFDRVAPFLLSAIIADGPLPENTDANKRLQDKILAITAPPPPRPVDPLPETARRISGNTYALARNSLGFRSFSLDFGSGDSAEGSLSLINPVSGEPTQWVFPIGLDDTYRFSPHGRFGLAFGVKGHWSQENEFTLLLNEIANINAFTYTMTFEGDSVTVALGEKTGLAREVFEGRLQSD